LKNDISLSDPNPLWLKSYCPYLKTIQFAESGWFIDKRNTATQHDSANYDSANYDYLIMILFNYDYLIMI